MGSRRFYAWLLAWPIQRQFRESLTWNQTTSRMPSMVSATQSIVWFNPDRCSSTVRGAWVPPQRSATQITDSTERTKLRPRALIVWRRTTSWSSGSAEEVTQRWQTVRSWLTGAWWLNRTYTMISQRLTHEGKGTHLWAGTAEALATRASVWPRLKGAEEIWIIPEPLGAAEAGAAGQGDWGPAGAVSNDWLYTD